MAVYTDVLDTSFNYPGIDIYQRMKDGVFRNYLARAQEGFVFYDTTANDTEPVIDPVTGEAMLDPETGMIIVQPVTYYYTIRIFSVIYDMANFSLVAVPRDSVDENYIYGVGDNDHVVA